MIERMVSGSCLTYGILGILREEIWVERAGNETACEFQFRLDARPFRLIAEDVVGTVSMAGG
jgi:hypothetical protein